MARDSHPADVSYRPIRASIAASLGDLASDLTTDVCLVVACLADGKHAEWLAALGTPADERDMLHDLARIQDEYRAEIQAMRAITDTLTAAGLALGLPAALVEQRILDKKRRELFAFPEGQD